MKLHFYRLMPFFFSFQMTDERLFANKIEEKKNKQSYRIHKTCGNSNKRKEK